jgi:hypothetical protein
MAKASIEAQALSTKNLVALAANSDLSQRLRHGDRGDDWNVPDYVQWRDKKKFQYMDIQEKAAQIVEREMNRDWTPDSLLASLVRECADFDSVLIYAIACRAKIISDSLKTRAIGAYDAAPVFYDRLLAQLLPQVCLKIKAERLATEAYNAGVNVSAQADWGAYLRVQDERVRETIQGCKSGLRSVDDALLGLSGLVLLAGLPGCGKSTLAMQFAVSALRAHPDLAVLFVQIDPGMSRTLMYDRLRCAVAGISYRDYLSDRTETVLEKLKAGDRELNDVILPRLRVASRPQSTDDDPELVDADFIRARIQRLRSHTCASRVLVVIDYLGHIDVPAEVAPTSFEADEQRIRQICDAREKSEDIFLVIAEVVKSSGSTLSAQDIKGGISKQYVADKILVLDLDSQADGTDAEIKVNLRIVKGRDGTQRVTIPLVFDHEKYVFHERHARRARSSAAPVVADAKSINPMAGLEDDD